VTPNSALVTTPWLRYWRTRRRLSQSLLAELAHVSLGTVRRLEAGGRARVQTVHQLAVALKLPPQLLTLPPLSHSEQ
jgi:transcriptional regulator with XRE-family HTH domain